MLLAIIIIIAALIGYGQSEEQAQVYCGRKLAEAHRVYCFNSVTPLKRSSMRDFALGLFKNQRVVYPDSEHLYASALRGKRDPGLVDECCFKSCYISELISYC